MYEDKLISGKCPNCNCELIFSNDDRKTGKTSCPKCNYLFDLNSTIEPEFGSYIESSVSGVYNKNGSLRSYKAVITHTGLNKTVVLTDSNKDILLHKVSNNLEKLKEQWEFESAVYEARCFTDEINATIEPLQNILQDSLIKPIVASWDRHKKSLTYPIEEPTFNENPPVFDEVPPFPNLFQQVIELFSEDYKNKRIKNKLDNYNDLLNKFNERKANFEVALDRWKLEKEDFIDKANKCNKRIEKEKNNYEAGAKKGIEKYYKYLLDDSEYPKDFYRKAVLEYRPEDKTLLVEYELPDKDIVPEYKGAKYNKTSKEIEYIEFNQSARDDLYDNILYQIPIRTAKEVFENDSKEYVDNLLFNGVVDTIDKATGNRKVVCILSIYINKGDFGKFDLYKIDPKSCFRGLKGVCSSKLSSIAPITPIMVLNTNDKRFREGREIIESIEDAENIATMDWEDFEHLVREVFDKEFGGSGIEVKVTQSSRDLGVDAVIFDNDPIRGGKIIVQAKRYNNTVKVESVRALYGIMQDEGAMKGIMVTTSDYGPEAYKFAQGKPITLINGGNLLALLNKYGHKARINLKEKIV